MQAHVSHDLAAVGDNTIDIYVGARRHRQVGGNAVNVAVQLRRLGNAVAYLGAVGSDPNADEVADALAAEKLELSGLVRAGGRTSTSLITVSADGERSFEHEDFGACAGYRPTEREIARLAGMSAVHIGWLRDDGRLRTILRDSPTLVSQDCAVTPGCDGLDIAFGSCGEGEDAAAAARALLHDGARLAVVTRAAAGSLATDGERSWSCPAAPVSPVVDTTGAGDSYIAGFLDAYLTDRNVAAAMHAGARLAAGVIQRYGAW